MSETQLFYIFWTGTWNQISNSRYNSLFRSVRAIFLERFCLTYRTDGAKEIENIGCYKHIVPTGLKSISHI